MKDISPTHDTLKLGDVELATCTPEEKEELKAKLLHAVSKVSRLFTCGNIFYESYNSSHNTTKGTKALKHIQIKHQVLNCSSSAGLAFCNVEELIQAFFMFHLDLLPVASSLNYKRLAKQPSHEDVTNWYAQNLRQKAEKRKREKEEHERQLAMVKERKRLRRQAEQAQNDRAENECIFDGVSNLSCTPSNTRQSEYQVMN